jgi:hypothetical protein
MIKEMAGEKRGGKSARKQRITENKKRDKKED